MLTLTSLFGNDARVLRETNFQLILLAAMLPVLGTTLVSPVLDSLIGPFGASSATIGLVISAFSAPAIVMIPVAGVLVDRYSRKLVLVCSLVLFGASGTAIAFTTDFRVVLALRLLQGVAFAGVDPTLITSIGDLYSGEKEATGQGLRNTFAGLSGAVFPLFAGVLVILAWQYPFFLYALAFPVALGVALWFDEPTASTQTAVTDGGGPSYPRALFRLYRRRRVLAVVIARALITAVWYGFMTYNSLIVVQLIGGTPVQAGLLAMVGMFVFAVSASQAGRITAMFESRLYVLVGANVCLGAGFGSVLFAPGIGVATIAIATSGVGFGILASIYRSIITGFGPAELRGGLVSLSEAGSRLMATVTPLVIGGTIALAEPTMGFESALRLAGVGVAIVAAGGGIACLFVAKASQPVSMDYAG